MALGTWVAHGTKEADAEPGTGVLATHVIWVLLAELTLLAGFTVGWEVSGARPAGWAQFSLLATLAAAMGMQSSAVNDMGLTQVSTTYLTGTLTGLVSSLVSPRQETPDSGRRVGVLIGLVAGASLCGLFVATAADVVPILPLAALITTLTLATGPGWRPRRGGDQHHRGSLLLPGTGLTHDDAGSSRNVTGGWQGVGMRPALKAGLLPVWRDRDTLQFGTDPRRAKALGGLGRPRP